MTNDELYGAEEHKKAIDRDSFLWAESAEFRS